MADKNCSTFEQEEEEFFTHIDNEDSKKIKEILTSNNKEIWKYRSKENENSTILHISVYKKLYKITKYLIEYCKKNNSEGFVDFINETNKQGTTAIHFAAFKGDIKIIKLLIENGANIYIRTNRGLNIIHYSAQGNKSTSLMFFYLKYYVFAEKENLEIKNLIKASDSGGSTPLHWAAYSNAEDILLYLIHLNIFNDENERQEFINKKDLQGLTPLHLSVSSKSLRIVVKLLQSGAKSDIKDNKGNTPFQLAVNKKQKEIAEVIKNNQNCELCHLKAPVKQLKKSIKNIILVFLFQALTTFIIFISVLSIALNTSKDDTNPLYDLTFLIYCFLLILFFLIYIALLIIDPGEIKPNTLEDLKFLINDKKDLNRYCYECFVPKSKNVKHCIICHKCYRNFDHHCFWINKCVAKNNYCFFLIFLVVAFIYLLFVLLLGILGIIHLIGGNEENIYEYNLGGFVFRSDYLCNNKLYYYILNISLIIIDLFFLIPETLLLILHLHLYRTNYKTNKSKINLSEEKNEITSSMETALMREDTNSFDSSNI